MAYIGVSPSNGVRRVHTYTATASQTTFSGAGAEGTSLSYKDSNFVDVYQNGIKLGDADYTSTSGTSIVLAQGASVDDLVVVVVFDVFSVADTVSKADGGTFDGNVTMAGTLDVTGNGTVGGTLGVTGALTGTSATLTTSDNTDQLTLISTDADASRGPRLALTRNSGSPADNDVTGTIKFNAKNDANEDIELFEINTQIIDASDGTEDASMGINGILGGASTNRVTYKSNETVFNDDSADLDFRVETDGTANALFIEGSSDRVHIGASSTVNNAFWWSGLGGNDAYAYFGNDASASTNAVLFVNRNASDGVLIYFRQGNTNEGDIAVSGSTVSYNGFSGRHESSGIPTNTPVGTVVSTIDALDVYPNNTTDTEGNTITHPKAGQTRADHPKVEVSTSVGDPCVYGIVSEFNNDGKLIVASVGIGSIRVTGACSKGDLLESNGDGTAKVQSDDIIRSKTIGKVTIGNSDTNEKLVSCVMYCG